MFHKCYKKQAVSSIPSPWKTTEIYTTHPTVHSYGCSKGMQQTSPQETNTLVESPVFLESTANSFRALPFISENLGLTKA
jgi:hypothetical protein